MRSLSLLALLVLVLAGCGGPQVPATVAVPQTVTVPETVVVPVTVLAPQTVIVSQTVVVPQTVVGRETVVSIMEVTAVPAPTATIVARPTATPRSKVDVRWTTEQVLGALKQAGLEAEDHRPMTREDYGLAPYVGSGVRFLIPSLCADCGGRLFSTENATDVALLKAYYDEMGRQSALLFSWTFARDNILLQINGDLPEASAKQYEEALLGLQ